MQTCVLNSERASEQEETDACFVTFFSMAFSDACLLSEESRINFSVNDKSRALGKLGINLTCMAGWPSSVSEDCVNNFQSATHDAGCTTQEMRGARHRKVEMVQFRQLLVCFHSGALILTAGLLPLCSSSSSNQLQQDCPASLLLDKANITENQPLPIGSPNLTCSV